ncbi:MAG: tRNA (cytidine(34)-2'-O)-methyltransferase [Deltaproteobacteria bacterium]|nr:tRNA (cytidine(34)-2'-O)-methyltransferase [Deltaproteobacteria bacterium]
MSESISRSQKRITDPALHIILFEPEIPANTGNISRLCAAAELPLHLIHPLGFKTDDRNLKRAGLDYWSEVDVREHETFAAFVDFWQKITPSPAPLIALSAKAQKNYNTVTAIAPGFGLIFGPETRGLPQTILETYPSCTVPMWGKVRSLNLSTTVGIVAYHFLQQLKVF